VREWLADPNGSQVFRLFGFAGTGKTTLAKELAASVKGNVLFATLTGKAALVLRKKGCDDASTIHSLIYKVEVDQYTGEAHFNLDPDSNLTRAELLVIDEVSMVGEELATDLLSFKKRILVLGDPAQLPPVKGEGFFINAEPDVMLTEVHRQARDNPIIRMSMDIREGGRLALGQYGDSAVLRRGDIDREALSKAVLGAGQVICGLNRTRTSYNARVRQLKGLAGDAAVWHPAVGDRLICLRNKRDKAIFNGGMWNLERIDLFDGAKLKLVARSLDEERDPVEVEVFQNFFNGTENDLDWRSKRGTEEFTFGWAITCHKSQGSQWDDVLIFDESGAFRESRAN
jgi:exodeoxyribonuclease-5